MKKIILTITFGLIAATAVGVWYFSGLDTDIQGVDQARVLDAESELSVTSNPEQIKGKDSLMSLFKLGKSLECTFSFSSGNLKGEGTGYFDSGKSRIDSLYTGDGKAPMASYMITDSVTNMMYSWFLNDDKMTGIKTTLPKEVDTAAGETPALPPPPSAAPHVTPETDVTYDCKSWAVDSSVFVPPSDVEFVDMSAMQEMMGSIER